MIHYRRPCGLLSVILAFLVLAPGLRALELCKIFSDHMVLQRERPLKVWGWAAPGQSVAVSFAGQNKKAQAGADGSWAVMLDPLPASAAPGEMVIGAGSDSVTIKDVLVGEVWVCSGQSNMEWTLDRTDGAKEAIAQADYPLIRQFKVQHVTAITPQKNLPGAWAVCSPQTAGQFSGVAYYFGLDLYRALDVPIGLVNTSWGGTRIEPWTDPKGFDISPALKDVSDFIAGADEMHREDLKVYLDKMQTWVEASRAALRAKAALPEFPGSVPPHPLSRHDRPTSIYNAMVAPLVPFAMRGAIWYQGESNNGEGMLYYEKMKALISSWRRLWSEGDFPFLFVQLAPFRYNRPESLPGIWDAQRRALGIPNTGMAVITDIGNISDIHPRNKSEVGRRLSLWALAKTYGKKGLVYSGPLYQSMKVEGKRAVVRFDHAQGLKSRDGKPLTWFSLAGPDLEFVQAQAEIKGETVVVSSDKVSEPTAVRLGWDETAEPNLINGAGLPASPFRTDEW